MYATRLDSRKLIRRSALLSFRRSLKRTNTGKQYGSRRKSRKRLFLQGLIQLAAAFYHLQRGNCAGTISLLRSALLRLVDYPEVFAGAVGMPPRVAIRCLARSPSKQVRSFRGRQFRSFN